jgi:hypothetical protein
MNGEKDEIALLQACRKDFPIVNAEQICYERINPKYRVNRIFCCQVVVDGVSAFVGGWMLEVRPGKAAILFRPNGELYLCIHV